MTQTVQYRYTHGQGVNKVYDDLTARSQAGTLTADNLREAVLTIDEGIGDCNHYSIGGHWIINKSQLFWEAVDDALEFYRSCLDVPIFMQYLLLSKEALMAIADLTARVGFILEAYDAHGAINHDWMQVALEVGVSRDAVAAVIIRRLRKATTNFLPPQPRWDMNDFIRYGHSALGKRMPPWALMNASELFEAIMLCCCIMPQEVHGALHELEKTDKLSEAQLAVIRRAAYAHAQVMGPAQL